MHGANTQAKPQHCASRPPVAVSPLSSAISTAVLATTLTLNSAPSLAGSCNPMPIPANAMVSCTMPANSGSDVTQNLAIAAPDFPNGTTLDVSTGANFGIDTSAGNAITLTGGAGAFSNGMNLRFNSTATQAMDMANPTRGIISGATTGIEANSMFGSIDITTGNTVTVTGRDGDGIGAYSLFPGRNANTDPEFNISAGAVTGFTNGISVDVNRGLTLDPGLDVSVTTSGTVTGGSGNGIYAYAYYHDTMTIRTTAEVTGSTNGIRTNDGFTGPGVTNNSTTITTSSSVTGTTGNGIFAHRGGFGPIDISTLAPDPNQIPTIKGGVNGIYVSSNSSYSQSTTITTNTIVEGGSGAGIYARLNFNSQPLSVATITLRDGSDVSSTSGTAIINNDSDSVVTIESGAAVSGSILLNSGVDTLTIQAVDVGAITQLDGGGETGDILTFEGSSGSVDVNLDTRWQLIHLNNNAAVTFNDGTVTAEAVNVSDGSTLGLTGTLMLDGALNNDGAVSLVDEGSSTDDIATITGDYAANSELHFDAVLDDASGGGSADFVEFQGSVTGTTEVFINNVMAGLGAETVDPGIPLIRTGSVSGSFVLGEEVRDGDYVYELVSVADGSDFVWHLQSSFSPAPAGAEEIPTLGAWAMAALSSLLLGLGGWFSQRKRRPHGQCS